MQQHDADHESRHGPGDVAKDAKSEVDGATGTLRGERAGPGAHEHDNDERDGDELRGHGGCLPHQRIDVGAREIAGDRRSVYRHHRRAEPVREESLEPVPVALEDRRGEVVLHLEQAPLLEPLLSAEQQWVGVVEREPEGGERGERDPEQQRDREQDAPHDVGDHLCDRRGFKASSSVSPAKFTQTSKRTRIAIGRSPSHHCTPGPGTALAIMLPSVGFSA